MRPRLLVATLFATALCFSTPAPASEWQATLLGFKMVIPDEGWSSAKPNQPNLRIARKKPDLTLFAFSANPLTAQVAASVAQSPETAEKIMQSIVAAANEQYAKARGKEGTIPTQKTTVDGVLAYRFLAPPVAYPNNLTLHTEFILWVHRGHILSLTLISPGIPAAENPELAALVKSIRLEKP